jgi:cytochrome oxidase Cu insertion factor (SCO1/SenC/PrrC family)
VLKAYVTNFGPDFVACAARRETTAVAKHFKVFYAKVPGKTPPATPWTTRPAATCSTPRAGAPVHALRQRAEALAHDLKILLAEAWAAA